ncbi:hypothetical protein [Nocardioides convexus]|uniref:hypothetical protein n=1 Tax=Nocardioides convexus TaxID=2712224 RepID=UPI0024185121|nr:hypothetical protein [Nocardioides convexus]
MPGTSRVFGPRPRDPLPNRTWSFAVVAEIGTPVTQVQHARLVEPKPDPTPQRGGQEVPRRSQVLALIDERVGPAAEQVVDLLIARRHPYRLGPGARRTVELIDRLGHHHAGQGMNVALVTGDHELEEPRYRAGLAFHCGPGQPAVAAQPGQVPVHVRAAGDPDGLSEEAGELDDRRTLGVDVTVRQAGTDHRQRVLVDNLLLEHLRIGGRRQSPRRVERTHDRQSHARSLGSRIHITRHRYQILFRNPEIISSIRGGVACAR